MSKKNDSWGIEVGANALKAMRLVRDGTEVEVAAYDVIPFKKVLTTPDLNVDEAIQVNLDQFLTRHDISKSSVVVSVPGNMAFARFAKLPPVEPKKIPDIVRFEAQQQIPFPIDQVEWDYQVFAQDDSPDVEVGIFAISKERVAQFLSNYNRMNIKIDALTLSPLAVVNALGYDMNLLKEGKGTIILDIGTTSTDLVVVEGGRVWMRTMAIGGNNFTEALVKSFKLSFPKAEKLKREAGTSKYARQIFQAMRPVFADLVQDIQRSLGFYQTSNRDAELHQLIGVGSTFRLPGLQKFLKQQLEIDIIRPDGFKKIRVDGKQAADFAENALNMATAYGLALQGLELEQVSANILPEHVVKARMWRAKQVWIAAASLILLLSVGAAWFKVASEKAAYARDKVATDQIVNPVISQAQSLKSQLDTNVKASDPRMRIENLQRVLDYRDVWPKLMEDISMAAATLGAQSELGEPDYNIHKSIPRNQRRRVFITSYDARYVESRTTAAPGTGATPAPAAGTPIRKLTREEAFGPRPAMQSPEAMMPEGGPVAPAPGTPADPNAKTRPSIIITIQGTTPYTNNTSQFLSSNFLEFLRTKLDREDRPYRIVKESIELSNFDVVTAEEKKDGSTTTPTTPERGGRRTVPPRGSTLPEEGAVIPRGRRVPVAPSPTLPELGPGTGRPGTVEGGAQQEELKPLYPVRPLADESPVGDRMFTITWTVELLSPEEVRQREDAAKKDAAPSAQTAPVSNHAVASTVASTKESR